MQVDLHTKDGQTQGQIDLLDDVFAVEPNENAMHKAVVAYLAHKRQGTHKTKTRKDVRGGGRKPWRQKGRGTARAGSIRSPLWVGGGTIHGPQPHKYNFKLSKKVRQLAKKSALSLRLAENNMKVVVDFTFEEIKTKQMADVLKNLNVYGESTLILLPKEDYNLFMSGRNIDKLTIYPAEQVSTYEILRHKNVLMFEGAAKSLSTAFSN